MKILLFLFILWSLCFPKEDLSKEDVERLAELMSGSIGGSASKGIVGGLNIRRGFQFPEVVFEMQDVVGSHSKEEIENVVDNGMLGLRSVYYRHLRKKYGFKGKVLTKFIIAKNGEISEVDIIHSSTGNSEFDEAVKKELYSWKWNAKNSSTTTTILFNFDVIYQSRSGAIISGPRLANETLGSLIQKYPRLRNVYIRYLKLKSGFNGHIVLRFTIAGSGEVTNADIIASTTEYAEFDEAVKKELSTWKWKPIESDNATVAVIIYSFYE